MLDGPSVVAALKESGVTHVVWIPDTELGRWEPALTEAGGCLNSYVTLLPAPQRTVCSR